MAVTNIPEVINNFNVYKEGNALIGLSGEVTLPDFDSMTASISGPGILGEIDAPILGMFGSMEQEITFRILDEDIFSVMNPMETTTLTLRASEQSTVKSTGKLDFKGMRVVVGGRYKKLSTGKVKQGEAMDASVTIELTYILIEVDGKKKIELDKLNGVYKVDGKDLLEKVRSQC